MKTYAGKAKVKDNSTFVYRGLILDITGVYIEFKDGKGVGVYADGTREYNVDFSMHPDMVKQQGYSTTVIHDSHLEILDLWEVTELPLSQDETLELIAFARNCGYEDAESVLSLFLDESKRKSVLPIPDLSTLYTDKEWEKKEKTK